MKKDGKWMATEVWWMHEWMGEMGGGMIGVKKDVNDRQMDVQEVNEHAKNKNVVQAIVNKLWCILKGFAIMVV